MPNTYEAVIFDCDGVLVNSEEINIEVEMLILVRYGLDFERDEYIKLFMGHSHDYIRTKLDEICDARGLTRLPEDIFEICGRHCKDLQKQELQAVAGIKVLLDELGHKCAVATNSQSHEVDFKLSHTDLKRYFNDHVYSRDMVQKGKPAPDLYLRAAKELGVHPSKCLVVEDSAQGVKAAVAAGMTVVGYVGGGHCPDEHDYDLYEAGAAHVIEHMDELPEILQNSQILKQKQKIPARNP